MAPRQVVPLIFGAGIDRASGLFTREGRAGYDLRNLLLLRDKAQVRRGHLKVNELVLGGGPTITDVVLVQAMLAEQIGVVAGLGNDGTVHLFRVGGDGVGLAEIGTLITIPGGAHTPPRLLAAEQYNKLFISHDEPSQTLRQVTRYYDPYGAPALTDLMADLDGDGTPAAVKFRGVMPYLTYVVGWGWGTETDPNHPETIRISDPEDATSFAPDDYFLAGTGGSPVLTCQMAGDPINSVLMVFKPKEIHQIFGYDRDSFGIKQVEGGLGVASSRLAYSFGGVVYFWDPDEGPRKTAGGPSEDLAWPLDLNAPAPADLVAEGAVEDGFACYLPVRRQLLFVFGKRVYCLSLWDASALKWSYWELPFAAQSGGVLYSGLDTPATPPTSRAGNVVLTETGDTSLHVAWDNGVDVPLSGGEIAELWLHAITADLWSLASEVAASGASQTADLTGVAPGTDYEVQIRYRRGPYYRADYTGAPSTWPSGSLSNTPVSTTITAPVLGAAVWSRVSHVVEQVALTWSGNASIESLVCRSGTVPPIATVPAGTFSYNDTTISGETSYTYTVTQKADTESAVSNAITVWTGPAAGVTDLTLISCESRYEATWNQSTGDAAQVDLADETVSSTWYSDLRFMGTITGYRFVAAADGGPVPDPVTVGDTIGVRVRLVETAFGIDDFSPDAQETAAFSASPCA